MPNSWMACTNSSLRKQRACVRHFEYTFMSQALHEARYLHTGCRLMFSYIYGILDRLSKGEAYERKTAHYYY
jgi:hypothetical protein